MALQVQSILHHHVVSTLFRHSPFSCVGHLFPLSYHFISPLPSRLFRPACGRCSSPPHSNQLQLWDTAGQERFRKSMVQHYYRNVHAVLFVYDVTCPTSFSSLTSWVEECRKNSLGQEIPRWLPQMCLCWLNVCPSKLRRGLNLQSVTLPTCVGASFLPSFGVERVLVLLPRNCWPSKIFVFINING